jgi:acyl-CoA oxidase
LSSSAWGERVVLEEFNSTIAKADKSVQGILSQVRDLFAVNVIENDLAWFMMQGLVSTKQGQSIVKQSQNLCKVLGKQSLALVQAFGIPDHLVGAPIAGDWIKYNEYDNQGEYIR